MYANTTAEVEVEKESLRRRRIYLFIVSATIFFLILFVATITPLLILKSLDDQHAASIHQSEYSSADHWAITFHSTIVESISSVHALGGYVMSTMNVLPPLHGTVAERLAGQTFTRFPAVAGLVSSTMGEIAFQALAPGGAFLETFPPDSSSVGFDMFSTANPIATESPTPQATLLAGTTMTVGPHRTTIPGLHDLWTIDIYHPIYNITNYVDHSADNFWGFAVSSISLDSILENNNLPAVMEGANMDYMLYGRLSNGTYYVVETSMPAEYLTSQKHIKRFLSSSSSGTPILDYLEFTIAVQSREKSMHLTSTNVTIIVSCAVAGTLLIFAIAACLISSRTARYDGRKYAPKQAPFALLTVGPTNGEELWTAAPERMDAVTERLTALLKRSMVEHEAYEIAQLQSYTTSYVLRSVPEAVEMALTIIEELQRHPVDAALRGLTECDPHVWMAYAVHWCTEATVLIDPTGSSYAYEGKDVVYGGRLRVFAQPNRLTLSGAAKTAWLDELAMQHRQVPDAITLEPLVIATPPGASKERFEDLWLYTDRRRKLAVEAMEAAAKRVSLPPQQGTNNSFMDEDGMDGGIGGSAHRRNAGSTEDDSSHGTPLMSITALEELGYTPVARHHVRQASTGRLNSKITVVVPQNPGGEASPHAGAKASGAPPLSAPESEGAHIPSRRPGASTTEGSQSNLGRGSGTNRSMATVCLIEEGDAVTRLLLSPTIPPWLAKALRTAFDHQAIALGIDFDTVRVMVYYFYVSYKLLFAPLATPERANINRRLVTAFGVPQRGITEHLAARCAIRYLQQREEVRSRMWNRQLRQREHTAAVASPPQSSSTVHAPAQPRVSTASETASVRS